MLFELSVTRHEEKDSKISWISTFCFQYVAKKKLYRKGDSRFVVYNQIWLNLHRHDHHFWYSFLSAFFLLRIFAKMQNPLVASEQEKTRKFWKFHPNVHGCLSRFTRFASCFLSPLLLFVMVASLLKHRNPIGHHIQPRYPPFIQVFLRYLLPFWLTKDYISEALDVSNLAL